MTNTIQQLEDLKEWSKDSTRYERRLAFRGHMPSTEAGTIPPEWDELSDREQEYYRTGPWSTREDYRKGQLVQPGPGRPGYSGEDSFKPLMTETEKAHYKRQYGKDYNLDDWREGNFTKKEKFTSGKEKVKRSPDRLRADFRQSFNKYLKQETGLTDLSKRGYISIRELNKLMGGKDTQAIIDGLSRGIKHSPWVEEIKGVKNWKKSRLATDLSMVEGGGKVFYKRPSEDLLKRLKSYYKNQEYLSDFKYGKIKGNTIKNVQLLYDDEVLMDSIKKWTAKDKKVPLKIIEAIFGDGHTGPNSVVQLGKALKGDIKIPGVRKNVALGEKIIDAMAWEARKGRGPWQGAAYEYAKGEMDNLFELKKGQWNFNKYYNETRKIMNEAGVPGVIDEVISLRTGFKNNQQVYSIFSQVIDADINDSYKSGYDSRFSTKQHQIRNLIADKPEGWQKEVDDLVKTHEGNYKKMKTRFGDVEFGRFGKFDVNTGTFQNPIEVFGEKRWNQLPKDIQAKILQGYDNTGISLNVGKTQTQKELYKKFKIKPPVSGGPALHSFPANLPGMFKKMGAIPRKVLGWTGADIGFYYLDKWNEMSKGKSEKEAAGTALDNATLGAYNNKTYIEGLKKSAKEMGIDPRAFENVYKMNEKMGKVQKQHETYQKRIEKLEGMEASPERDKMLERITNAYNKWQEGMDPEIDKWQQGILDDISISKTGGIASPLELSKARESLTEDDWYKPFIDIQNVALGKLEKEKAAAYDMQSKQVNPEAGNIGDWLETNIFTLNAPAKIEEQERIDDMLDFDPKELYRYNIARGLDPDAPITWEAYNTLKSEHPGLGFSGAQGGIAGLLKK